MEFCETCDNMLYTKIVEESESKTNKIIAGDIIHLSK